MPEYNKEDFKAECDRRRNENLIVKGKTYDLLLENYAAWHMAVGQGFDG